MGNAFGQKLKKLLSESRQVPLKTIKNRDIDRFSRKLAKIYWRPHYLFEDTRNKKYLAFSIIYDAESFPTILSQEVEKVKTQCSLDFFFIVEEESLLDIFEENCQQRGLGLVLSKSNSLSLVREAVESVIPVKTRARYAGHYPSWVINAIPELRLGNSKLRTVLKDFSKVYRKLKNNNELDFQKEEGLVKNTIAESLKSDNRYTSGVDSFKLLSRFESFVDYIRDHYFHSFHIFLLGLLILDHYQADFVRYYKSIFPRYKSLSLEFTWLLTSIFHDVGYPIAKLDDLKEDIYGVSGIPGEKEVTDVWGDPVYKENLKQLISLFKFSLSNRGHKIDWPSEVFGTADDQLERVFRESFYDCHGVAGCFRFLVDIFSEARREVDTEKKVFLVNHIYPAALSISLHDRIFRERLTQIGVKKIRLSRFPFAVLLGYLDSLQEDRRDKFLCIETPELLQGFEYNGKVLASINETLAERYPRFGKLKAECTDFMNFVECDGIKFEYPKLLSL